MERDGEKQSINANGCYVGNSSPDLSSEAVWAKSSIRKAAIILISCLGGRRCVVGVISPASPILAK